MKVSAWIALVLIVAGCRDIPYRIEFGRKNSARSPSPSVVAKDAPMAWTTWVTVHRDLSRAFQLRGRGAPPPHQYIEGCVQAIQRLEQFYPDEGEFLTGIEERYLRLGQGRSAILAWVSKELERIYLDLDALRRRTANEAGSEAETPRPSTDKTSNPINHP